MPTELRNIDYVRVLHLRKVGIALAGLWVIVLVAAVSATIYREFDGPTIRSTVSENVNLTTINSTLNENLNSARDANNNALGQLSRRKRTSPSLILNSEILNLKYLTSEPGLR